MFRDTRFANYKAPCTAIWQQPLQSVLALRGCSATDLLFVCFKDMYNNLTFKLLGKINYFGRNNFLIKQIFPKNSIKGIFRKVCLIKKNSDQSNLFPLKV